MSKSLTRHLMTGCPSGLFFFVNHWTKSWSQLWTTCFFLVCGGDLQGTILTPVRDEWCHWVFVFCIVLYCSAIVTKGTLDVTSTGFENSHFWNSCAYYFPCSFLLLFFFFLTELDQWSQKSPFPIETDCCQMCGFFKPLVWHRASIWCTYEFRINGIW